MKELVILKNRQAVTTSLKVAEIFGKNHQHVLRDIDAFKKDVSNFGQMFKEDNIPDSYGRNRRVYFMNRDGFTLVVMGYTGKKALEFKLKYIEAFNKMELFLMKQAQLPQTPEEKIDLLLENSHHTSERIRTLENTVDDIKNRFGLPSNMAHQFTTVRNKKVINVLNGKESNAYQDKSLRRQVYTALFASFKKAFDCDRYNDTPMSAFDDVITFTNNWYPPFELQQEIQASNAQQQFDI